MANSRSQALRGADVGAFVELAIDRCEEIFLEHCLQQPGLQLICRERLDQVIIRRQFRDRDDVVIRTLTGDDHEHRTQRNQLLLAQLFEQLLAVAPIVEEIVGKDDIEAAPWPDAAHRPEFPAPVTEVMPSEESMTRSESRAAG